MSTAAKLSSRQAAGGAGGTGGGAAPPPPPTGGAGGRGSGTPGAGSAAIMIGRGGRAVAHPPPPTGGAGGCGSVTLGAGSAAIMIGGLTVPLSTCQKAKPVKPSSVVRAATRTALLALPASVTGAPQVAPPSADTR